MLDEFTLGIVAIFASILILIGWVPQIIQGYKTKKLEDVSKFGYSHIWRSCIMVNLWNFNRRHLHNWSECGSHVFNDDSPYDEVEIREIF